MLRLILLLLVLLQLPAIAQPGNTGGVMLTMTDIRYDMPLADKGWLFSGADDAAMAQPGYDDSRWLRVHPALDSIKDGKPWYDFNSIGWFRLHFVADSTVVNTPLALTLSHLGASEVYLDGTFLQANGYINGKDSSEYLNPATTPTFFVIDRPGHHVLAIRYANYNANENYRKYQHAQKGFTAKIGPARRFVTEFDNMLGTTFTLILLAGIFIALCVAHLFLYLYNRAVPSNLFFSIFCFSFSLFFFSTWLISASTAPATFLSAVRIMPFTISAMCFSLSGLVNNLFSVKKLRFAIITLICAAACILTYFDRELAIGAYIITLLLVMVEAFVLVIVAMYHRIKGARIIGAGISLFTFFIVIALAKLLITQEGLNVGLGSAESLILAFMMTLAILSLPISMSMFLAWNFAYVNKELKINLRQVKELSEKTIAQELEKTRIIEGQKEQLEREVAARTAEVVAQNDQLEKQHNELKSEKRKSDELLLNILPAEVAEELKEKGQTDAHQYNNVSVLFTDFVGFTKAGERMSPQELVNELHICFRTFDEIVSKYHIEKIKTIGDAYLAVAGLPVADPDHAVHITMAALEIQAFMQARRQQLGERTFNIRIGINSGSVVAGIVGIKKFAYDIWGDTVNTAARMESTSEPGRINVSEATYSLIAHRFRCTHRGLVDAKGKGEMNMYFVDSEI